MDVPSAVASLAPGAVVGGYVVEALLGRGGMGEVWRARDRSLLRPVALKVLSPESDLDPSVRARFVREGRAAAALVHPNVVTVYGAGEDGGRTYIAMELVEGRTFRLASPYVPAQQRLAWLLEIARALSAVHGAGFVHRDVKPDNVMVTPHGTIKLLDFGIARAPNVPTDGPPSLARTGTGQILGTPRYIAPEQWRGGSVDGRADQFAWAVMAYEALAGRHPDDTSPGFGRVADWRGPAAPLHALVPDLPFGVSSIVGRAMAVFPDQRFPTMAQLCAELEACLRQHASAGLAATSPSFGEASTTGGLPPTRRESLGVPPSAPTSQPMLVPSPPAPPRVEQGNTAAVFVKALLAVPLIALAATGVFVAVRGDVRLAAPPSTAAPPTTTATPPEPPAPVVDASAVTPLDATPSATAPPPRAAPLPPPLCGRWRSAAVKTTGFTGFPYNGDAAAWERALAAPIFACFARATPPKLCDANSVRIGVEVEDKNGTNFGFIHSVVIENQPPWAEDSLVRCLARAIETKAPKPYAAPRYNGFLVVTFAP